MTLVKAKLKIIDKMIPSYLDPNHCRREKCKNLQCLNSFAKREPNEKLLVDCSANERVVDGYGDVVRLPVGPRGVPSPGDYRLPSSHFQQGVVVG